MPTRVVERDAELGVLVAAAEAAAAGRGSVVLVTGGAGLGKSSLVRALGRRLPGGARLLVGACDDLDTPRPLGPLRDLGHVVGADLARAVRDGGDRDRLLAALRAELDWAGHATVLVIEDVHWADAATIDLLRLLVRRVDELPAVVVLTWRDDDLAATHPLRQLLASLATTGQALRLPLAPLSREAVADLVGELAPGGRPPIDAVALHELTDGHPFFVHELLEDHLRAGPDQAPLGVPGSVVDVVLAGLGRLDPGARDAVERLSVLTVPASRDLVGDLVPGGVAALADAERSGLVEVHPEHVSFRHELTRRAVLDALPGLRRSALHARALEVLSCDPATEPARLVHHAVGSGDVDALLRHGPQAAGAARADHAHREALSHLAAVLAHRGRLGPARLADLLEASAQECYTVGDDGRGAVPDQMEAVALRRRLEDPVALGSSLRWLSRIAWWCGDRAGAETAGAEAVEVLRGTDARQALGLALSNLAQLAMLAEQTEEAISAAEQAITIARDVGDVEVLAHALNNLGTARWSAGDPGGRAVLEESLAVAREHGLGDEASRAWCNLVWQLLLQLQPREAAAHLETAIVHAERAEHLVFGTYLHVERAMVALAQARWDDAVTDASIGLTSTAPIRCAALTVLARVAVRTAAPAHDLVEECWRLATRLDELQRVAPAGGVVCEAAWLSGDHDRVREVAGAVLERARAVGATVWVPEAAYWLVRAGGTLDGDGAPDHPWTSLLAGDWAAARRTWEQAGYPVEAALALTHAPDVATVLEGLRSLDALGAAAWADRVRHDLRTAGARGVPRGPQPATRAHPGGLTPRQHEVLDLLVDGHSNAAIARRLVLSVRTVDHHVAAVLHRLGARNREEAAALARERGWSHGTADLGVGGARDGQPTPTPTSSPRV